MYFFVYSTHIFKAPRAGLSSCDLIQNSHLNDFEHFFLISYRQFWSVVNSAISKISRTLKIPLYISQASLMEKSLLVYVNTYDSYTNFELPTYHF